MAKEEKKSPAGFRAFLGSSKNLLFFLASFVLAWVLMNALSDPGFSFSQHAVLFLLIFAIGLWLTEAIPPFAVGLFIMAYLVYVLGNRWINPHPQDVAKYVQTFSNSIIWLMLGGFFLAEAMTKTKIDLDFFRLAIRLSGRQPKRILLGVMLMTMVASMVLSNSATTSMVIASMMPLLMSQRGKAIDKALLSGIPLAAGIGGMGTIIGSPTNAIAAGALENAGISISFIQWMGLGVPLAILLTLAGWLLLSFIHLRSSTAVEIDLLGGDEQNRDPAMKRDRLIVFLIFGVTVLLWLTTSLHHLGVAAVAAIPIVFLTMLGVLKAPDIRKMPWDTLLLVAGGLSLGLALQETKLLEHFAKYLLATSMSPLALMLVFAYVTMAFSNIMSNTATSTILIPLGIFLKPDHAREIALTIGLAASTGMLLPVSTPPVAISYSTGLVSQKEFLPGGLAMGILGPALIVFLVNWLG